MKNQTAYLTIWTLVWALAFYLPLNRTMAVETVPQSRNQNNNLDLGRNIKIMTSFFPITVSALYLTQNLEGVSVQGLVAPSTGCLHDYHLSMAEAKALNLTKEILVNGLGIESFLKKTNIRQISSTEGVSLIFDKQVFDKQVFDKQVFDKQDANPHVWVSPKQYLIQVGNIYKYLESKIRFELKLHSESEEQANLEKKLQTLSSNLNSYRNEILNIQSQFQNLTAKIPNKKLIAFHEAYAYWAKEFGFQILSTIDADHEPSAQDLARLIDLAKKQKPFAIICENEFGTKSASILSREAKVPLLVLDPVVKGKQEPNAWILAMKKNIEALRLEIIKQETTKQGKSL